MRARVIWVCLYAVAMAAVESAVVVYLRALHPGDAPLTVLLNVIPDRLIAVEVAREVATLIMLLAVGMLAGRDRWERFLWFSLAFGAWDIFYYVWLWVFIGWPPSLFTWDVLFLIPVPWLGPVLAPVLVSVCLVAGSVWLLVRHRRGVPPGFPPIVWALATAGAGLVLLSFMLDYRYALERTDPPAFRWGLFLAGVAVAVSAVGYGRRP
ncbi:MAG TPA: hypothetical protein VGA20_03505 [Gemmatimonadales bacterium]